MNFLFDRQRERSESYVELLQFHRERVPLWDCDFQSWNDNCFAVGNVTENISIFLADIFHRFLFSLQKSFRCQLILFSFQVLSENSGNKISNYDLLARFKALCFDMPWSATVFFGPLFINTNSLSSNYQHLLTFINNFFLPLPLSHTHEYSEFRSKKEKNLFQL